MVVNATAQRVLGDSDHRPVCNSTHMRATFLPRPRLLVQSLTRSIVLFATLSSLPHARPTNVEKTTSQKQRQKGGDIRECVSRRRCIFGENYDRKMDVPTAGFLFLSFFFF